MSSNAEICRQIALLQNALIAKKQAKPKPKLTFASKNMTLVSGGGTGSSIGGGQKSSSDAFVRRGNCLVRAGTEQSKKLVLKPAQAIIPRQYLIRPPFIPRPSNNQRAGGVRAKRKLVKKYSNKSMLVVDGQKFEKTSHSQLVNSSIVAAKRKENSSFKLSRRLSRTIKRQKKSRNIHMKPKRPQKHCKYYSRFGSCIKKPCAYIHDEARVLMCTHFLRGKCTDLSCKYSHKPTEFKVPLCVHFIRGLCTKEDCIYLHVKPSTGSPICRDFACTGYCQKGAQCQDQHFFKCPDFAATGICKDAKCKLFHRKAGASGGSALKNDALANSLDGIRTEDFDISIEPFQIRPDFDAPLMDDDSSETDSDESGSDDSSDSEQSDDSLDVASEDYESWMPPVFDEDV